MTKQAAIFQTIKENACSARKILCSAHKRQPAIIQAQRSNPEEEVALKRWMYRGGHPNKLAKILNWGWAIIHSLGIFPNWLVTLEVAGRRSGRIISFPLALTVMNGERYLVAMLGEETNWVRNVKAARGKAELRHGIREQVLLEEVDAGQRAPILKAYLQRAPGARPHISIHKDAPISEFEKIASKYPVFRLEPRRK